MRGAKLRGCIWNVRRKIGDVFYNKIITLPGNSSSSAANKNVNLFEARDDIEIPIPGSMSFMWFVICVRGEVKL